MDTLMCAKPFVALFAIYALLLVAVAAATLPLLRTAYRNAKPLTRWLFAVAVGGATLYGGGKRGGNISFPTTDPETRYLANNGSWVSNDTVHVAFTKSILVPQTATFYVDYYDWRLTNEYDIATNVATAFSATFAARPVPFDLSFVAATNYDWFIYTDWTPPPVVHTNGVAYVEWQIGSVTNRLATTRTGVYTNAVKLAPNPAMTNLPPFTPTLNLTNSNNEE